MVRKLQILNSNHNRSGFSCGIQVLDSYIKERATQDIKRGICAVHVLSENETEIIGFYTLAPHAIHISTLPIEIAKKYPSDLPLSCWLIGRLAVDVKYQKQGIGKILLMDALNKILKLSEQAGGYCIAVDAKDECVKQFYMKYGFEPITTNPLRLFLPIKSIQF